MLCCLLCELYHISFVMLLLNQPLSGRSMITVRRLYFIYLLKDVPLIVICSLSALEAESLRWWRLVSTGGGVPFLCAGLSSPGVILLLCMQGWQGWSSAGYLTPGGPPLQVVSLSFSHYLHFLQPVIIVYSVFTGLFISTIRLFKIKNSCLMKLGLSTLSITNLR